MGREARLYREIDATSRPRIAQARRYGRGWYATNRLIAIHPALRLAKRSGLTDFHF
jgi:hypothetical protein